MMMKKSMRYLLMLTAVVVVLSGCGVYSFTGASIPPEAKTVSIAYFPNNARLVNETLSQSFTDAMKDKFLSQTNLILLDSDGDLAFSGSITGYNTKPLAIQSNETAALNRLTITVKVKFENRFDPAMNFETTFSQYNDYPSDQQLSTVAEGLIEEINGFLVEDIFNKAVVNW